jgi:hypothetical protein
MAASFFEPDGERFIPTEWTRGPWRADAAHAGPPAALLGRAVEALDPPGPEMLVARFAVEVLRPVPLRPLTVRAAVVRPGKRVQLAEATMYDSDTEVARAAVWRIRPRDLLDRELNMGPSDFPGPLECPPVEPFRPGWEPSYFDAMELRSAHGDWSQPGPAALWMRMRVDLVSGEPPGPLTRTLVAADSGNGISWELPLGPFLFVNLDLSVHLARMPEGEWVCLDAISRIGRQGIGLAGSRLWDRRGRFGTGAQALLVTEA